MKKLLSRLRGSNQGFTLMECMVALTLLGIGGMALCASQVTSFKVMQNAQCMYQANIMADEVFEVIMRDPTRVSGATVTSSCSGSGDSFSGDLCQAISSSTTAFMQDPTVTINLIDDAKRIWRVTIDWSSSGIHSTLTKDIGLAS